MSFSLRYLVVFDDARLEAGGGCCLTVTCCLRKDKDHTLAALPPRPSANWLLIVHRHRGWCSPVPIKHSTEKCTGPPGLVIALFGRYSPVSAWKTTITTSAHSSGSWTQVRCRQREGVPTQLMLHMLQIQSDSYRVLWSENFIWYHPFVLPFKSTLVAYVLKQGATSVLINWVSIAKRDRWVSWRQTKGREPPMFLNNLLKQFI